MRLIDAKRMKEAIKNYFKGCIESDIPMIDAVDGSNDICGIVDMVAAAYPVDAVEVVRCKDCKHCLRFDNDPYPHCWWYMAEIQDNDFCSHGERRTE